MTTTKQDPSLIEELQKPAKLEFRIVNVKADAPIPIQEGEEWTDDEGIPFGCRMFISAFTRSDVESP